VQTVTVINRAHVNASALRRVEQAVQFQATVLRAYWSTPLIRFGSGGWKFTILVNAPDPTAGGEHGFLPTTEGRPVYVCLGRPAHCVIGAEGLFSPDAWVSTSGQPWLQWSAKFSHEILEMLVDPYANVRTAGGSLVEVCDPVNGRTYRVLGVPVSDFMLPDWFFGGRGPHDAIGAFRRTPRER
jgi:hypothetical protein